MFTRNKGFSTDEPEAAHMETLIISSTISESMNFADFAITDQGVPPKQQLCRCVSFALRVPD